MARPITLEEFDLARPPPPTDDSPDQDALSEQEKLNAFEQGYQAGWDDSSAAQHQDQSRITADLESALKDLSFTFHEARTHVLQGVEPLVRELVATILPTYAQDGLPSMVAERLATVFSELSDRPVVLSVSTRARPAVEAALPSDPGFPITIREEPTLADGQVFLNLGATEEMIDLDNAIRSVQAAIDDFFDINQRMQANG